MLKQFILERKHDFIFRWSILLLFVLLQVALIVLRSNNLLAAESRSIPLIVDVVTLFLLAFLLGREIFYTLPYEYDNEAFMIQHLVPLSANDKMIAKLLHVLFTLVLILLLSFGLVILGQQVFLLEEPPSLFLRTIYQMSIWEGLHFALALIVQLFFVITLLWIIQSIRRTMQNTKRSNQRWSRGIVHLVDFIVLIIVYIGLSYLSNYATTNLPVYIDLQNFALNNAPMAAERLESYVIWSLATETGIDSILGLKLLPFIIQIVEGSIFYAITNALYSDKIDW